MNPEHPARHPSSALAPLFAAWLALVALTLLSLALGAWFHGSDWLPPAVALLIWLKGTLVARHFIEAPLAHPFIRWLLRAFVAFAPLALVGIAFFGGEFARWATL
ncbi:hypothetical protein [Pseudothauera rhizosphaerae]|uniref:Cytochrome C oxidase subunit IV n=1 Tax=Pseudothauera rhizosphaerae TaxID=2565932 RepID=A0A4S4A9W4_9RHOO|nr:hypothetical protein [Pseudothauera rhizosphaerae]THF55366.1 hypothetical protein E6O51_20730 [Pseudothauera rhizosphaerae]